MTEQQLMTVKELAIYLRKSRGSIYSMVCLGKIPDDCIVKIGRALRFDKARIDLWRNGEHPSQEIRVIES